ncbi:MAG: hypothetical protein ABSA12_06190 [Verrucomicrobiia bacterium]|jgi:hypothetical protein
MDESNRVMILAKPVRIIGIVLLGLAGVMVARHVFAAPPQQPVSLVFSQPITNGVVYLTAINVPTGVFTMILQMSTTMTNPDWTDVATNPVDAGFIIFDAITVTNASAFFRARGEYGE